MWQIPELEAQGAEALLELWPPGSFLVTGHDPSQVLVLRTGPSPGEVNTYQIQKLPGGEVPTPEFPVNSKFIKNSQLYFQNISQIFPILSASITLVQATITSFLGLLSVAFSLVSLHRPFPSCNSFSPQQPEWYFSQSDVIHFCLKLCKGYAISLDKNLKSSSWLIRYFSSQPAHLSTCHPSFTLLQPHCSLLCSSSTLDESQPQGLCICSPRINALP